MMVNQDYLNAWELYKQKLNSAPAGADPYAADPEDFNMPQYTDAYQAYQQSANPLGLTNEELMTSGDPSIRKMPNMYGTTVEQFALSNNMPVDEVMNMINTSTDPNQLNAQINQIVNASQAQAMGDTDFLDRVGDATSLSSLADSALAAGADISTLGAVDVGRTPITGTVSDIADLAGDVGSGIYQGLTEGDASSQAFNQMWPYKQEQLAGASAAFQDPTSMYPGFSADTQSYIDQIKGRVESGNITLDQAQQELSGLFGRTDPSAGFYQDLAAGGIGQDDPSRGFYQQMQGGMFADPSLQGYQQLGESRNPYTGMVEGAVGGINPALQELQKTSAGGYIGKNPYLADIYERGAEDITERYQKAIEGTNASFNLMGGFGSSARPDVLAERQSDLAGELGGLYGDIYGGDYARERDRQLQATGQLGGLYDVGVGRGLQGAGMLSDIYGQDIGTQFGALSGASGASQQNLANQLAGTQGLSDVYQTGINRQLQGAGGTSDIYGQGFQQSLSTIDPAFRFASQDYSDLGMLGGVGGMQDVLATQQAQEPWQQVSQYGAAIGGIPQQQQGAGNPMLSLLGAGVGGYFGGVPGASLGAGLGGLFS